MGLPMIVIRRHFWPTGVPHELNYEFTSDMFCRSPIQLSVLGEESSPDLRVVENKPIYYRVLKITWHSVMETELGSDFVRYWFSQPIQDVPLH